MLFTKVPELNHHRYQDFGSCIYCGESRSLTDEHIVPFGLGGNAILPKASCRKCAKETGKFEQAVLRGVFQPLRDFQEIQSRRNYNSSSKKYKVNIESKKGGETLGVSAINSPVLTHFPIFAEPGYFRAPSDNNLKLNGIVSILNGCAPEEFTREAEATKISLESPGIKPVEFAKMIAKIAFGMAVATGGFKGQDHTKSFVVPALKGISNDIGRWVGTITEPIFSSKYHKHRILIHRDQKKGLLIGDVQLFSNSETPRYGVILGELNEKI